MIAQSADLTAFFSRIQQKMTEDGQPSDKIEFSDVVKKPLKKQAAKKEQA